MIALAFLAPFGMLAAAVVFLASSLELGRRLERIVAQTGDVDPDGEIVDELRERVDGAVGPLADDVDREDHLYLVLREIARNRGLTGDAR